MTVSVAAPIPLTRADSPLGRTVTGYPTDIWNDYMSVAVEQTGYESFPAASNIRATASNVYQAPETTAPPSVSETPTTSEAPAPETTQAQAPATTEAPATPAAG